MGGRNTQDALATLKWAGQTAIQPYQQFATSALDLPGGIAEQAVEGTRPALQTVLGRNAGDLMTDQLKTSGAVLAPTLLMPEAEEGKLAEALGEGGEGLEAGKTAKTAKKAMAAGRAILNEETPGVGEVSHKAHLTRHVARLATGLEGKENEEEQQEPMAYSTPAPNYQQILRMLGGGLGPLMGARRI